MVSSVNSGNLELISSSAFLETLVKLKVRKSTSDVPNLRSFLRFNRNEADMIMVKKLTKVIEEFSQNQYLKLMGT